MMMQGPGRLAVPPQEPVLNKKKENISWVCNNKQLANG